MALLVLGRAKNSEAGMPSLWIYQHSIHSKTALPSSSCEFHVLVSRSSSCIVCQNGSIIALSCQSPTVPIEPKPWVLSRFPNAHDVYCVP